MAAVSTRPRREHMEPLWDRVDRNRLKLAVLVLAFIAGSALGFVVAVRDSVVLARCSEVPPTLAAAVAGVLDRHRATPALAVALAAGAWAGFTLLRSEKWLLTRFNATLVPKGELLDTKFALKDMALAAGLARRAGALRHAGDEHERLRLRRAPPPSGRRHHRGLHAQAHRRPAAGRVRQPRRPARIRRHHRVDGRHSAHVAGARVAGVSAHGRRDDRPGRPIRCPRSADGAGQGRATRGRQWTRAVLRVRDGLRPACRVDCRRAPSGAAAAPPRRPTPKACSCSRTRSRWCRR